MTVALWVIAVQLTVIALTMIGIRSELEALRHHHELFPPPEEQEIVFEPSEKDEPPPPPTLATG